jgi:hypothetical protein
MAGAPSPQRQRLAPPAPVRRMRRGFSASDHKADGCRRACCRPLRAIRHRRNARISGLRSAPSRHAYRTLFSLPSKETAALNWRPAKGGEVHRFGSFFRRTWAAVRKIERMQQSMGGRARLSHACECFDHFCAIGPSASGAQLGANGRIV